IKVSTDPFKDNKISKITVDVKTDPNKGIEVTDKGLGIKLQTGNNPLYVNQDGLGINPQTLVENAQLPVVYTDAAGNKLSIKDGKFVGEDGKAVDPADVIASINNGKGSTTQPTNLANVAGNLTPTYNAGDMIVGPDGKLINEPVTEATRVQEAPQGQDLANMYNNAATVGDVLNAGFNLQENGWSRDFVKAYDTVNFIDGEGTKASVITDQNGKESMIKFDINVDDTKGITIAPNTGKLGIKINADGPLITDKDGLNIQTDGTTIKVEGNQLIANTATLDDANKDGKIEIGRDGDQNALVTAKTVADAINKAGFKIATKQGDGGEIIGDAKDALIKAGEAATFEAANNIKLKQQGGQVTIATKDDVNFTSVQFGDNGPKITKDAQDSLKVSGNNGTDPVKITNVKAGDQDTDAVNFSQLTQAKADAATKYFADQGDATSKDVARAVAGNKIGIKGGQTGKQLNDKNITTKFDEVNNLIEVALNPDVKGLNSLQFADGQGIKIGDKNTKADAGIAIGRGATAERNAIVGIGLKGNPEFKLDYSSAPKHASGKTYAPGDGVAVGDDGIAAKGATALGSHAHAKGVFGVAAGINAAANGTAAISIGAGSQAIADGSIAQGREAVALGSYSSAVGYVSLADGAGAIASGHSATAQGVRAIAIGSGNAFSDKYDDSTNTQATKVDAIAVGSNAKSVAERAIAIGRDAKAERADGVALGSSSVADRAAVTGAVITSTQTVDGQKVNQVYSPVDNFAGNQTDVVDDLDMVIRNTVKGNLGAVSVGDKNNTRQITNVAAGSSDTDAANIAQLKAVAGLPFTVEADQLGSVDVKLGDRLPIKGATNGGIVTKADLATNGLTVEVKPNNAMGVQLTPGGVAVKIEEGNNNPLQFGNKGGIELKVDDNTLAVDNDTNVLGGDKKLKVKLADKGGIIANDAGNNGDKGLRVNVDETTIKLNENGQVAAKTTALVDTNQDGKIDTPDNGDSLVTAKTVANAINNSGFTLATSQDGNGQAVGDSALIKAGEKVTLEAGDNISVTQAGGKVRITTTDDVVFNNVSAKQGVVVGDTADGRTAIRITSTGNAGREKNIITGLSDNLPRAGNTLAIDLPNGFDLSGEADPEKLTRAANVADVLSTGFNLQSNSNAVDFVRAYDTLNFADGNLTTVDVATEKTGKISTIKVNVNAQGIVENAQLPVVYTDKKGNKLVKKDGSFYQVTPNGGASRIKVENDQVIASMNNGNGETKQAPMTLANVAHNITIKPTIDDKPAFYSEKPKNADAIQNNAATVGDVLNVGFNLKERGVGKDFVQAFDTLDIIDGNGTTARVNTDEARQSSTITFDVKPNRQKGIMVDTDGVGINIDDNAGLEFKQTADKSASKLAVKADGTTIKVEGNAVKANTTDLTVNTDISNIDADDLGEVKLAKEDQGNA
ncbi:hypothetical protein M2R47_09160, partial [Moraxella sp. Tifton1]|uniref:hypothetical protein n=1 Tax=Moraxella oculi TaxID=2940516 RepID=UPI002011AA23